MKKLEAYFFPLKHARVFKTPNRLAFLGCSGKEAHQGSLSRLAKFDL